MKGALLKQIEEYFEKENNADMLNKVKQLEELLKPDPVKVLSNAPEEVIIGDKKFQIKEASWLIKALVTEKVAKIMNLLNYDPSDYKKFDEAVLNFLYGVKKTDMVEVTNLFCEIIYLLINQRPVRKSELDRFDLDNPDKALAKEQISLDDIKMKYTGKDFFNLAWKVLEMSDYINFIRPLKAALEMKDLTGELKKQTNSSTR
jgi:hypothetical protein